MTSTERGQWDLYHQRISSALPLNPKALCDADPMHTDLDHPSWKSEFMEWTLGDLRKSWKADERVWVDLSIAPDDLYLRHIHPHTLHLDTCLVHSTLLQVNFFIPSSLVAINKSAALPSSPPLAPSSTASTQFTSYTAGVTSKSSSNGSPSCFTTFMRNHQRAWIPLPSCKPSALLQRLFHMEGT